MNETLLTEVDWISLTHELGKEFADRAKQSDDEGTFVFQNYERLKEHRFFSAMVPEQFGGGGVTHEQMCDIIRILGSYCGSTALAFSMHQHLIAATVWKNKHKGEGGPLLEKVASQQLVLVSTGARDWLDSNGEMSKTDGGYILTAKKAFASQSAAGNIAVTSAPYQKPDGEWVVLHFSVPFGTPGVSLLNDWDTMGMRATGSQTINFEKVFVPESAVVLERPRTGYHGVWDLVIGVAMPLIMSAYVGIAERAMKIALNIGKGYPRNKKHLPYIAGKLNNVLLSAQVQWRAMVALTSNFEFKPNEDVTLNMLSLKTNVSDVCQEVVSGAMEMIGGQSFYKKNELERLFRDVQAGPFHPLPKWEQYAFTGERLLAKA